MSRRRWIPWISLFLISWIVSTVSAGIVLAGQLPNAPTSEVHAIPHHPLSLPLFVLDDTEELGIDEEDGAHDAYDHVFDTPWTFTPAHAVSSFKPVLSSKPRISCPVFLRNRVLRL